MIIDPRAYADTVATEDEAIAAARARAAEIGLTPVSPAVGSTLRLLALLVGARNAVEVGTGTGVSGLWLLSALPDDGVLTSVDPEAEHHRLARRSFADAGVPARRTRLIPGRPAEVLPRLTDSGYDLVLIDRDPRAYADYVAEALRLLRPGGVLVVHDALAGDRVPDGAARDPDTVAVRSLITALTADETLDTALLPVGAGLLVALKH